MKKILSGIIAASVMLCSMASVFAAPQYTSRGSILIESDINATTNTKKATIRGSAKVDITKLFIWTAVNSSRTSEKAFVITSDTGRIEDGTTHPYIPVDMRLRITNDSASKKKKYIAGETDVETSDDGSVSVFEYFTLIVKNDKEVIFTADDIPGDTTEIEIPLRLFNYDGEGGISSKNYSDEGKYTVSLRENTDIDKDNVTEYAYPTKWKWYIDAKQQPNLVNGEPTPSPKPTPTPTPTPTPKASQNTDNTQDISDNKDADVLSRKDINLKAGDYIVGKDIAAGKYYVVGSGMLQTYDADGVMTGNVDLSAAVDANGYYTITLRNEESISLSDDAEFKITAPIAEEPTSTPRVRVTPTPRVRITPTPRVKASPTPTPKASSSKATPTPTPKATPKPNPKTGDTAPIFGLSALGMLSLCAIIVIQMKKKNS